MLCINRFSVNFAGVLIRFKNIIAFVMLIQSQALFAHAQFTMDSVTPPRFDTNSLKQPPGSPLLCGNESIFAARKTNMKTIWDMNSTLDLTWFESVSHTGLYYIDFSPQGDIFDISTRVSVTDDNTTVNYAVSYVLPMGITCENCTVRMRQTMDGAVLGSSKRHYFSCADIAIVDKTKMQSPAAVTNIAANNLAATSLELSWTTADGTTAADSTSEVVIVRKKMTNASSTLDESVNNFTHYPVGKSINVDPSLMVVYRGTGTTFIDSGLLPETRYGYEIFARNSNYNYNPGSLQYFTTAADGATNPGNDPDTDPGNGGGATVSADSKSDTGAIYAMLLLLGGFSIRRIINS